MYSEKFNQLNNYYSCLGETIVGKLIALEKKRCMTRNLIWSILTIVSVSLFLFSVFGGSKSILLPAVAYSTLFCISLSAASYLLRNYMSILYKKELPQIVVESVSSELRIEHGDSIVGEDNVPVNMMTGYFYVGCGDDTVYDDCICFRRNKAGVRKRGYIIEIGNDNNTLWTMPMNGVVRREQTEDKESAETDAKNGQKIQYIDGNHQVAKKQQLAQIYLPSGESLLDRMMSLYKELRDIGYLNSRDKLRIGMSDNDLFICIPTIHDLFEASDQMITVDDMLIEQRFVTAYITLYHDLNPEQEDGQEPKQMRSTLRVGSYDRHSSSSSSQKGFNTPLAFLVVIVLSIIGYLTYSGKSLNDIMLHHHNVESIKLMRQSLDNKEYDKCEQIGKKFLEEIAEENGYKASEKKLALSVEANQLMVELYSHKKDSLGMFRHYRMAIANEQERINVIGKDDYVGFDGYIILGEMYHAMGLAYDKYKKHREAQRHYILAIRAFEKADSVIPPYENEKRKAPFIRNRNKCHKTLAETYYMMAYSYAYDKNYKKAHESIDNAISYVNKNLGAGRYYDSKGELFLMQYKDQTEENHLDSAFHYWVEAHANDYLFDDYVKKNGGTNLSRGLEELGIDIDLMNYIYK